jgi:YD repeat-containing protein
VGDLHGWQADPYGQHETRYFSQGQPTRLVRDGDRETYDEVPSIRAAMNGSAPDQGNFGGVPPGSPSTSAIPAIAPSPAAGLNPPPAVGQLQGWEADPYRRHVYRYIIEGRPTVHVSDGGPVFEDDPAATPPVSEPREPASQHPATVGVWSMNDGQPEGSSGEPSPRRGESHVEEASPTDLICNSGRDDQAGARPLAELPGTGETFPETRGLHSVRSRGPEPGWYAGVSGTPGLHFWDGMQWTEHTWQDPLAQSTTLHAPEISTSSADLGPREPVARDMSVPSLVDEEGWRSDPLGRHQYRYFSQGQPTAHVSDAGHLSQDDPLRGAAAPVALAETPQPTPSPSPGSVLQAGRPTPTGVISSGTSATASPQDMSAMRGFNPMTHHRNRRVGRPIRMTAMNFATSSMAGRLGWSATVVGRSTTMAVPDENGAAPQRVHARALLRAEGPERRPAGLGR